MTSRASLSETGEAALEYARRGWHVFPAPPGEKKSYKSAAFSGGRAWGATVDPDEIKRDFLHWPAANVGIATGRESGFFAIECDTPEGHDVAGVDSMAALIDQHGGDWPSTIEALSPSASWHIYFNHPKNFDPKTCQGEIAPGVDVRGHGGMVLGVPSVKPGAIARYRWKNPPPLFEVADAPRWLLDLLPRRGAAGSANGKFDFNSAGGGWRGVEEYRQLILDASTDGKKHEATRDIASSLAKQGVSIVFATGLIQAICPVWDANLENSIRTGYEKYRRTDFRHKDFDLVRDNHDRPFWNIANADTLLTEHLDWQGVLAFDAFSFRRVLLRPMPGQSGGTFPRDLADDDYTAAATWFNKHGFPKATAPIVEATVRKVCHLRTFDPLIDYLDGLAWDGVKRIGTWLTRYCGAEDNEYIREAGRRWLISAVARAYQPGCKADCMLVLEGQQGALKSSVLRALAGSTWFSDSLPPMNTKDASSYLCGKWIVEVAELEAMRREVDAIKAFISRTTEDYRPAYGRENVKEPRRCVFAGTTNKDDWQRDETGGRRFWPVKVGAIDVPAVAGDRDQLWGEAVAAFRAGARWWLEGEAEDHARIEVAARQPDDPWRSEIVRIVAGHREIATKQVLAGLGISTADMNQALGKRVGAELLRIEWQRVGQFTSGPFKGSARYVPPPPPGAPEYE